MHIPYKIYNLNLAENIIRWFFYSFLLEFTYIYICKGALRIFLHRNLFTYLSTDIHTRTKLDRYNPNVRKKAMIRHKASPAFQDTVYAQPISIGIIRNVTSRSAIAKCINIMSILEGPRNLLLMSSTKTVIFPIDEMTIRTLKQK